MCEFLDVRRLVAVFVLASVGAGAYLFGSVRFDYSAHFLAGAGGTLILISAANMLWSLLSNRWPAAFAYSAPATAAATLASIGFGLVAEFTVFAAPVADLVDILHQSLGAIIVGIACVLLAGSRRSWIAVLVSEGITAGLGLVMIVIGAVLVGIV